MQLKTPVYRQLFRFAIVGVASNTALFLIYILSTNLGMGHKTAMTLLYAIGTSLTFTFNRNWTFAHKGHISRAFLEYVGIYALGYLVNLVALYILVDKIGYHHQAIQGGMIILIAILLFTLQKLLVFKES